MNDLVERLRRGAPGLYAEAMAWAELWDLMDNEQEPPMTTPRTVRRVLLIEAATDRSWSPDAITQAINEDPGDAPLGRDVVVHGALDLADLADIIRTTRRLAAQITEGRSAAALTHLTDKILASFDTLIPEDALAIPTPVGLSLDAVRIEIVSSLGSASEPIVDAATTTTTPAPSAAFHDSEGTGARRKECYR